jgi:Mn-dependent DtxR family transcriptional regulator
VVRSRSPSILFCRALLEETGGEILRWATITAVATRLGLEQEAAEALAAELAELGLVRVGGGHSVWLMEAGRQACKRPVKRTVARRPSTRPGKGRAKARAGRSR